MVSLFRGFAAIYLQHCPIGKIFATQSTMQRISIFFAIVLFLFTQNAVSQSITGKVGNAVSGKPMNGVTVVAVSFRDTTAKFTARTDSSGNFTVVANRGIYRVIIAQDGFRTWQGVAKLFRGDTNLGFIKLMDTALRMNEAVVMGKAASAVQRGDTSEYNAAAYKTNPDATAEDLIKKMPGVTVQNGNVTAHGEQVKKVTVDGKDWFGDDASAVLRNLPAEVVDKMQIFDRGSDQSNFSRVDDGTSSKSINIVTKKGLSNGKFGKAYVGYGTDERYQGGFNYNTFKGERRFTLLGMANNINQQNFTSSDLLGLSTGSGGGGRMGMGGMGMGGGSYGSGGGNYSMGGGQNSFSINQSNGINTTRSLGFNYIDKWNSHLSVAASYFFNSGINEKNSNVFRNYINNLNPEVSQLYNEKSDNTNNTYNHRANLRLTYTIDTNNIILYTPRLSFQHSDLTQVFSAGYRTRLDTLNNSNTRFTNIGSGMNLNNTVLLMHKFKKYGRNFSLNITNEINTKESEANNNNSNYTFQPFDSAFFINQRTKTSGPSTKWNTRFTYAEPLSVKSTLQFEYAYNYTKNESDKKTYNYDSATYGYTRVDTSLSNAFNNHFSTQQIGLMYMYRDAKWMFSVGGNFQIYNMTGQQVIPQREAVTFSMKNFLPRIMLNYKMSKTANIRAFGRASTNAPSVSQLQTVVDNSNPLLLTTGNKYLDQEVSGFGVIRYSKVNVEKGRNFFIGVLGNTTRNYISNNTTFFSNDTQISEGFTAQRGSQITRPVNLQGYYSTRVFGNYGFPLKLIKSNINFNGAYSFSHTPGLINDIKNIASTQNYNAGVVISSNISENIDFTASYSGNYYNTSNSYQKSLNNEYYTHNASLKANYILFKKLVFNTEYTLSNYSGLSNGFNQTFALWNAAIAYKFLKKNAGELRFSCFDMLKQNQSISRTITETYVEDNSTRVLQRYFMLTFTYNLRKINGKMPTAPTPPAGMPPGMMGPPPGH